MHIQFTAPTGTAHADIFQCTAITAIQMTLKMRYKKNCINALEHPGDLSTIDLIEIIAMKPVSNNKRGKIESVLMSDLHVKISTKAPAGIKGCGIGKKRFGAGCFENIG